MSVKLNDKGELLSATGYAAVVNGVVRFDSAANSPESAATLAHGENVQVVRVTVKPYTKRSLDANALLHVWCQLIGDATGEDRNSQKLILKIEFAIDELRKSSVYWPTIKKMLLGAGWKTMTYEQKKEVVALIPMTSIMTKDEMRNMMDSIKNWARNELNIELPNGKQAGEMQQ